MARLNVYHRFCRTKNQFLPRRRHYFFNLFKSRSASANLRPGAMTAEQVRSIVKSFGEGKLVEITRIGFDGHIDDQPMLVEIVNIYSDRFSGRIVNVEREMMEASSETLVYAKGGGGTIDFQYDDGDLKEIVESHDAEELSEATDVEAMKEIISALEVNDPILVSYYDRKLRGTANVEGHLSEKPEDGNGFTAVVEKINGVALSARQSRSFDLDKDVIIDISLI